MRIFVVCLTLARHCVDGTDGFLELGSLLLVGCVTFGWMFF